MASLVFTPRTDVPSSVILEPRYLEVLRIVVYCHWLLWAYWCVENIVPSLTNLDPSQKTLRRTWCTKLVAGLVVNTPLFNPCFLREIDWWDYNSSHWHLWFVFRVWSYGTCHFSTVSSFRSLWARDVLLSHHRRSGKHFCWVTTAEQRRVFVRSYSLFNVGHAHAFRTDSKKSICSRFHWYASAVNRSEDHNRAVALTWSFLWKSQQRWNIFHLYMHFPFSRYSWNVFCSMQPSFRSF